MASLYSPIVRSNRMSVLVLAYMRDELRTSQCFRQVVCLERPLSMAKQYQDKEETIRKHFLIIKLSKKVN